MKKALCAISILAFWASAALADVRVFAAASMKGALDEIGSAYQAKTGHHLIATYAASGALAKQIEQGAPADVFISADEDWMEAVSQKGLVRPETRHIIASNVLVVIASQDAPAALDIATLPAALADNRLALGEIKSVPAGKYAFAALHSLGLWQAVSPHVVMQDNVRGALALVARGEAKFGIVYASDAMAEAKVHVVATFPDTSHPPIHYPAAVVTASANPEAAAFNMFLSAKEAQDIFVANGFTLIK